jgi:DNA-binding NarL/FixJ family response regulator
VKRHVANIIGKLQVTSRHEASAAFEKLRMGP